MNKGQFDHSIKKDCEPDPKVDSSSAFAPTLPTDRKSRTHTVRVWLSPGYMHSSVPWTQTWHPQCRFVVLPGGSHEEVFPVSSCLASSLITPCRGGAKWSSSLSVKAHIIQTLLACISHHSSTQQGVLNQMTSFIFPGAMILDSLETEKQSSYPYFTDEYTEE